MNFRRRIVCSVGQVAGEGVGVVATAAGRVFQVCAVDHPCLVTLVEKKISLMYIT